MSSAEPVIDVVVPFGGGLTFLLEQLDALDRQNSASLQKVIIAVNCDLSASDAARLEEHRSNARVPIDVVLARDVKGPAHARNIGWRSSTADYIVFCDSDDRVGEGWVDAMRTAFNRAPLIGGRLDYEALNATMDARWQRGSIGGLPSRWNYLPFTPSSNMGVSRELLSAMHGFDETLTVGEDMDLCWRAQQAGYRISFEPGAVVHYRLRASLGEMARQAFRYGLGDRLLRRKHTSAGLGSSWRSTVKDMVAVPYFSLRALSVRSESWKRPVVIAANLLGHMLGRLMRA